MGEGPQAKAPRRRRHRSARVYVLPGIERRDLSPARTDAGRVLAAALDQGLSDVVLVGVDREGELYVAGSFRDCDKATGVMMRGVALIAGGRIGLIAGEVLDTSGDE